MRPLTSLLLAGLGLATAAACYVGPVEQDAKPVREQRPTDPGARERAPRDAALALEATGLPCDVDALLEKRCRSCHGPSPTNAPMPLVTYEDLSAPAPSDATRSVAELSLVRMTSTDEPMPPGEAAKATSAELASVERWIADGTPKATCGPTAGDAGTTSPRDSSADDGAAKADAAPDGAPADGGVASVCTSGLIWTSPEQGPRMNPGRACVTCHTAVTGGPTVQIGGTVYPTLREPDKCYGAEDASVVVTDATGRAVTLPTETTGNFSLSTNELALVYPIHVKVVQHGAERVMQGSPPHGDCNACHTATGKNGAPGRILLP